MNGSKHIIVKIFKIVLISIAVQIFLPCLKTFASNYIEIKNEYINNEIIDEEQSELDDYKRIIDNLMVDNKETIVSTKIEQDKKSDLTEEMLEDGYNAENLEKDKENEIELEDYDEEIDEEDNEEVDNEELTDSESEDEEDIDNEEDEESDEIDEEENTKEETEEVENIDSIKDNESEDEEIDEPADKIEIENQPKENIECEIIDNDPKEIEEQNGIEVEEQPKEKIVEEPEILENVDIDSIIIESNVEEEHKEVKIQILNTTPITKNTQEVVNTNINANKTENKDEKIKNEEEKKIIEVKNVESSKETILKQDKKIETNNSKERREKEEVVDSIRMKTLGAMFLGGMSIFLTALIITNKHNVKIFIEEKKGEDFIVGGKEKFSNKLRNIEIDSYLLKGEAYNNPVKIMLSKGLSKKLDGQEIKITHRGNIISKIVNYNNEAVEFVLD